MPNSFFNLDRGARAFDTDLAAMLQADGLGALDLSVLRFIASRCGTHNAGATMVDSMFCSQGTIAENTLLCDREIRNVLKRLTGPSKNPTGKPYLVKTEIKGRRERRYTINAELFNRLESPFDREGSGSPKPSWRKSAKPMTATPRPVPKDRCLYTPTDNYED
jgi:hypothetical protein